MYSFLTDVRALVFIYVIVKAYAVTYQAIGWLSKYLIWKHVLYCFLRMCANVDFIW